MLLALAAAARRRVFALCTGLCAVLLTSPAAAQRQEGFALGRFHAPPTVEDGLGRELPDTLGSGRFAAALVFDYAHSPLVLGTGDDLDSAGDIVANLMILHLSAAVGIGSRLQISMGLPLTISQSGDSPSLGSLSFDEPSSFAAGDPVLGGSVRLAGEERGPGSRLALSIEIPVPLGSEDDLSGDEGFGLRGRILFAHVLPALTLSLGAGAALRPEHDFDTARIGPELLFDGGLYVPVAASGVTLLLEMIGATGLREGQAFDGVGTNLEVLAGMRAALRSGLALGLGGGPGLTRGVGTPDVRLVATLGWGMPREERSLPPPPPPPPPPPSVADSDGDGLLDPDDACVREPEDRDEFEDGDGCPDPDDDGDGVLDQADHCRRVAEDTDEFEDDDGCPDPDDDQDGIADGVDRCPREPETANGIDDEDGCPDVRVEGTQIVLPRIEFETNRDVIREVSFPILEEVARVFREHTEIARAVVEGHTDDQGDDRHNLRLSRRRAASVVRWLTSHGIEASRLSSTGFGESRPRADNTTEEGRRENRRVEIHIVDSGS